MSHKIYLDYAATTPVDRKVLAAMRPYFSKRFGNAGSLHAYGQEAQAALDSAREKTAALLGAEFREIIFTGSATEANNLALRGALKAFRFQLSGSSNHLKADSSKLRPRIVVSAVEHESVLATAHDLEKEGAEVKIVPVDREGQVDLKKLRAALNEGTFLVSVMFAQNEVGTIQPLPEIARLIRDFREGRSKFGVRSSASNFPPRTPNVYPLLHTDAVQAIQFLDCSPEKLGVDLMTLSAHKIYGPKGAGVLFVKHETRNVKQKETFQDSSFKLRPIITGGGQEFGLRSGTENTPLVLGLAKALELTAAERGTAGERLGRLQRELWAGIKRAAPRAQLNGPAFGRERLPNNINVYLPGLPADKALTALDLCGIAASSGSACASRSASPSHVLLAMGLSERRARESVRFSLGRPTTSVEIKAAAALLRRALRGQQRKA